MVADLVVAFVAVVFKFHQRYRVCINIYTPRTSHVIVSIGQTLPSSDNFLLPKIQFTDVQLYSFDSSVATCLSALRRAGLSSFYVSSYICN